MPTRIVFTGRASIVVAEEPKVVRSLLKPELRSFAELRRDGDHALVYVKPDCVAYVEEFFSVVETG